ncbi:MAG: DNA-binding protein [Thermoprotei archaeon]|nr:MAG: DNA-binding protein [Thermoprotei archaeon]
MSQEVGVIYVGQKPTTNYVLAAVTQFSQGSKKVVFKARGRAISKAVNAALILKRFLTNRVDIEGVNIGSEKVGEPGKERMVSTIEISVIQKKEE